MASKIVGPSGASVPCKVEPGLGADNSVVRFVPREEGPYEVEVTYDGVPVPGSPFPLEAVPPTKPSKVTEVWGLPRLQACLCPYQAEDLGSRVREVAWLQFLTCPFSLR